MDSIKKLAVTESGFITNYLISGPRLMDFTDDKIDKDQLRYEKYLRSIVAEECSVIPEEEIKLGETSHIGEPWRYYYSSGNWFVDVSDFYSLLKKVDLLAAVNIYAEEAMEMPAYLWTYAAVDIFLNKEHICSVKNPVYKPILQKKMTLKLKKGSNLLYIKMQNLGVRDTRNIFGIQLLGQIEKVTIEMPDAEHSNPFVELGDWLTNIELIDNTLKFKEAAPPNTYLIYDNRNIDLTKVMERFEEIDVEGKSCVELKKGEPYVIIQSSIQGHKLARRIEILEEIKPKYTNEKLSREENNELIYKRIADVVQMDRGEDVGFSIYNILARTYLNRSLREIDEKLFQETLNHIEIRIDCSDFLMCALLRYIKNYTLENSLYEKTKEVILNYRYWMDQKGSDGMCFWSENHALMFYSSAMIAGEMFPNEYFVRAEKIGKKLYEDSRDKVLQWLLDIEQDGYEEFLSAGYMCVTFAALLNVVDFGDEELSKRATKLVDRLLEELCMHTFKGTVIAPQGRVYRDVIYPYTQGVQALINMIDPTKPYSLSEWLIFMATSKYKIPENLVELMNSPVNKEYATGNAFIKLNKTNNYIMTSVQSPREDEYPQFWSNISLNEEADRSTYLYTKSINERFHGTTRFEPGVYGYQQHMWYAALDLNTVIFTNHPGATFDGSSMRPGYWYGNGIMPAIKEQDNIIGSVYVIPDNYPIHFTHLYWTDINFDKVNKDKNWIFGKKNNAYIGVWCSGKMIPTNDMIFNAEYRTYADKVAYICYCSSAEACGDFENFKAECIKINPCFDENTLTLKTSKAFSIQYEKHENLTQYI